MAIAESESSELLDVSPYEGGNMLNSGIFRTTDIRWISANLDMREGKAFGHQPYLERGPSKFGFHVPSAEEREEVSDIVEELELTEYIHEALHLPKAGKMTGLDVVSEAGEEGYYLTRIPNANGTANVFHPSAEGSEMLQMAIKNAISVRGFRNTPVVPTKVWEKYGTYGPRIPSEYQEVEYIESDGNACVNLGILAKDVVKINLEASDFAMGSSYADSYSIVVFGTVANSWWCSSTYYTSNGNRFRYHMGLSNRPYLDCAGTQSGTKNTIEYTLSGFTVNGVSGSQIGTDSTRADASNSAICFWYCGNNSKSRYKMYSLKITTDTGEKTFVPCFRKADGVIGLFELSEGEFYTNVGTGRFLMGRDIAYLPKEYEQVEYVLNTTGDEYIDLGIVSNNSLKVSLMITPTQLNTDNGFIGGIWSANDFLLTCYNSRFRFHNGGTYIDTVTAAVNNKYNIWLDNTGILVNETRYGMNAGSSYGSHNLWIYHIDGQTNTNPRVKFYALRVWNQGEFVRDYVPCIRKSDGVIGFYDLVNGTFHTNQGGGAFIAGGRVDPGKDTEDRYPRMKTICYYPLTNDSKDEMSGNQPYSSRGSFTFNGKSCSISAGAMYWNLGNTLDFTKPFTVFQWLRPTQRRNFSMRLGYPMQNDTTTGGFEIWETRSDMGGTHPKFGLTEGSGAWNVNNGWDMPLNEWHCFVLVYTGTQLLVYRDGQVMDYSPIIGITSGGGFTPSGTATVMCFSVNNNYDYYDGDVAHLGVEAGAWDVNRVLRYYRTFVGDFQ